MEQALFSTKPGDLIEIFRGTYEHWAVYIGGNEVVHMTLPQEESGFLDMITFLASSTALVRRQKLSEVVGFHRFHVNNLMDGKCQPRERHLIVRDACRMEGRELPYDFATRNCEHFVTELRYGKPESRQVETAAVIGGVAVAGVALAALGAALFAGFSSKDGDDDNNNRRRRRRTNRKRW